VKVRLGKDEIMIDFLMTKEKDNLHNEFCMSILFVLATQVFWSPTLWLVS